jgi:hypothetical protein
MVWRQSQERLERWMCVPALRERAWLGWLELRRLILSIYFSALAALNHVSHWKRV